VLVFDGLEGGDFFCGHVFWFGYEEGFPCFFGGEVGVLEWTLDESRWDAGSSDAIVYATKSIDSICVMSDQFVVILPMR